VPTLAPLVQSLPANKSDINNKQTVAAVPFRERPPLFHVTVILTRAHFFRHIPKKSAVRRTLDLKQWRRTRILMNLDHTILSLCFSSLFSQLGILDVVLFLHPPL
jgi:hypothetical protein